MLSVGEIFTKPKPELASDPYVPQLVEKLLVWDSIERFLEVQEDHVTAILPVNGVVNDSMGQVSQTDPVPHKAELALRNLWTEEGYYLLVDN